MTKDSAPEKGTGTNTLVSVPVTKGIVTITFVFVTITKVNGTIPCLELVKNSQFEGQTGDSASNRDTKPALTPWGR